MDLAWELNFCHDNGCAKKWCFIYKYFFLFLLGSLKFIIRIIRMWGRHKNLEDLMLSSQDKRRENMKNQFFATPFMSKHNYIVS
jgi:hypothetical protein